MIWSHTGPAVTSTSTKTDANSPAKTTSDAGPRFQPRLTSAPTIGSRPSASTAARKIDSSVPSDRIASATSSPNSEQGQQHAAADDDLDTLRSHGATFDVRRAIRLTPSG